MAKLATYFKVRLGLGVIFMDGSFTSVTGIAREVDYETYLEGGAETCSYFYRQAAPQTLVLERGVVDGVDAFCSWLDMIGLGQRVPLTGTITLMSAQGESLKTWFIWGAYPIKYVGPTLVAKTSTLAVERLELAYSGCT